MSSTEALALVPLIVLAGAIGWLLLWISFFRSHRAALLWAVAGLLASFLTLVLIHPVAATATPLLSMDGLARYFIGMILVSAILISLLSFDYLEGSERAEEYYLLLLISTLGSVVLAASTGFASFFLGLEILSVSLYSLICYARGRDIGIEASIKYLVLAGSSSAFLLFGMALIYNATGSMEFAKLAALPRGIQSDPVVWAGSALILVGIGFKLALTPFHTWAPDIYEGAPAPISAYIATISKGGVFAVFLRYILQAHVFSGSPLFTAVTVLAIASMTAGNFLALLQRNIKRLLAYSSTAHLGYLLVGLLSGATLGASAIGFYLAAYFAMTLVAFGVVTGLSSARGGEPRDVDDLEQYQGLLWQYPGAATVLLIAMLSLAGIPLTAGFTAKFFILSAGVDSKLWLLVIFLVLNSAVGLFYYLRVVVTMAAPLDHEGALADRSFRFSGFARAAMIGLAGMVICLGVYPSPWIAAVHSAMAGMMR